MPPIQKSAAVSQPPHPYTDRTGVNLEQPIYKLFLLMYTVCT